MTPAYRAVTVIPSSRHKHRAEAARTLTLSRLNPFVLVLCLLGAALVASQPTTAAGETGARYIDAGSTRTWTDATSTAWSPDAHFVGGSVVTTNRVASDTPYKDIRQGMSAYRVPVPTAGRYDVTLHFIELVNQGRSKRIFDVRAENTLVIDDLDIYRSAGARTGLEQTFSVDVTDGVLDLDFAATRGLTMVAALEVVPSGAASLPSTPPTSSTTSSPAPTTSTTSAPAPTTSTTTPAPTSSTTTSAPAPTTTTTSAPAPTTSTTTSAPLPTITAAPVGGFPSVANTGPRYASTTTHGSVSTKADGQVIDRATINGRLTIQHDNVTVRDTTVNGVATYMVYIVKTADGSCPQNVRIEYTEISGSNASADSIPLYAPGACGFTFDHGTVHNVGRGLRISSNATINASYVLSSRTWDGAHRSSVSTHGGTNNRVTNNTLLCEKTGCSAAVTIYGDYSVVDGYLLQNNLIATTGGYCAYGGSLGSKSYPEGRNVKFLDNHFSTRYFPTCGRYGHVVSLDAGVRGNEWSGNVWAETGLPIG